MGLLCFDSITQVSAALQGRAVVAASHGGIYTAGVALSLGSAASSWATPASVARGQGLRVLVFSISTLSRRRRSLPIRLASEMERTA